MLKNCIMRLTQGFLVSIKQWLTLLKRLLLQQRMLTSHLLLLWSQHSRLTCKQNKRSRHRLLQLQMPATSYLPPHSPTREWLHTAQQFWPGQLLRKHWMTQQRKDRQRLRHQQQRQQYREQRACQGHQQQHRQRHLQRHHQLRLLYRLLLIQLRPHLLLHCQSLHKVILHLSTTLSATCRQCQPTLPPR